MKPGSKTTSDVGFGHGFPAKGLCSAPKLPVAFPKRAAARNKPNMGPVSGNLAVKLGSHGSREGFMLCTVFTCGGLYNITLPGDAPIAGQSRSHKIQSRSNVGHRCCFCFEFRRLISCKQEGSDVAWRARAHWWNSSNRCPIAVQLWSNRGLGR